MAVRTIEQHVDSLLSRRFAEAKSRGAPSPEVETSAIFESVALTLLMHPRTSLLIALTARNKLQKLVQDEVDLLEALKADIEDLANPSYTVRDTSILQRVRTNLLQLEGLEKVTTSNSAFVRFSKAIDEFLTQQLAKNVVDHDNGTMIRPAAEAQIDLPTDLAALKSVHSQMLDRLYSLAVGIENFLSSPLSTIIGTTTVARARDDLDGIIRIIRDNRSASNSRDIVIRLIGSRAAVRAIGSLPDPFTPVVAGSEGVRARTEEAPWLLESGRGPFAPSATPVRTGENSALVPCSSVSLAGKAFVIGQAATFSAPSDTRLFLTVDSTNYVVTPTGMTAQAVCNSINAAATPVRAALFAGTSNRIVLYCDLDFVITPDLDIINTRGELNALRPSAHQYLGLVLGGSVRTMEPEDLRDALLSHGFQCTASSDMKIRATSSTPLDVSFPLEWGVVVQEPRSYKLFLSEERDLNIGDYVVCGGKSATVASVLPDGITIDQAWAPTDDVVSITSVLVKKYQALADLLNEFLVEWDKTDYTSNLDRLDLAIAPLGGTTTPAHRNQALSEIDKLLTKLRSLHGVLAHPDTLLPGAKLAESDILNGIVTTLDERRLDRAINMLLKCQILEMLTLAPDEASYGAYMLKTASQLSQLDIRRPNYAIEDE